MPDIFLRLAPPDDAPQISRFVAELAKYEKLEHEVISSSDDFRKTLSDPNSNVEVLLAFWSGQPAGFALFLKTFRLSSANRAFTSKTCSCNPSTAPGELELRS